MLAALVIPATAIAEQPALRVGLDYHREEAPSDCPTRDELRRAIADQLGYDPFGNDPATDDPSTDGSAPRNYEVRVEIIGIGGGTRAHIEWLDGARRLEGERRLRSESHECDEIARAVVFAVAVQLQLRAANRPHAAPKPPPAPAPPPVPRAAPPSGRSFVASLGAFVEHGAQPGWAAGLRSFGALRERAWSLGVAAQATLPTTEQAATGGAFSARELGLNLAPCLRHGPFDACALASLGLLLVRGQGVDQARAPSAPLVGAGMRLQLTWPESDRVAALTHVDLLALFTSRDVLLNRERVWSTAPIVINLGLDLATLFR